MPIQYEHNSIMKTLAETPELTQAIREQVEYAVIQHKHSKQRALLIDQTIFNIIKAYKEIDMMIDGRINTNDQPF